MFFIFLRKYSVNYCVSREKYSLHHQTLSRFLALQIFRQDLQQLNAIGYFISLSLHIDFRSNITSSLTLPTYLKKRLNATFVFKILPTKISLEFPLRFSSHSPYSYQKLPAVRTYIFLFIFMEIHFMIIWLSINISYSRSLHAFQVSILPKK